MEFHAIAENGIKRLRPAIKGDMCEPPVGSDPIVTFRDWMKIATVYNSQWVASRSANQLESKRQREDFPQPADQSQNSVTGRHWVLEE
jgi:hypothetical protein